jgi:hypothetical protein
MLDASWRDILGLAAAIGGATVLAIVLYRRTSPTLPLKLRLLLGVLRWLAAAMIILLVTDPAVRLVREIYTRPVVAVMLDNSSSMARPDAAVKFDRARNALYQGLTGSLEERADLRLFAFSDRLVEIAQADAGGLTPSGSRTDLAGGMKSAIEAMGAKPSAFIILSDGAFNFGEDVLHYSASLRTPVHTVSLAAEEATPDISIDRLDVNESAYANSDVTVGIVMSGSHSEALETEVAVRDSSGVIATVPVVLPGTGAKTRVEMDINAGGIGVHEFSVVLSPMDDELVTENNTAPFSLKVIKGRIRVGLIASGPSWDFAFARRYLRADPNIEVATLLTGEKARGLELGDRSGWGGMASDLDVAVVLGDAASGAVGQGLRDFVWNGGGVLLIGGGGKAAPGEEMSPFTVSAETRRGEHLFSPSLTDEGLGHEIMRLEGTDAVFSWPDLPPVPLDNRVGGTRKEAAILLSALRNGRTLPMFAVMKFGRGRIAAFSAFDLWRWDFVPKGFGAVASPFYRLLVNSVGWLTEREEAKRLAVSSLKSIYTRGEPAGLSAQVTDESLKPLDRAILEGEITDRASGEVVREFSMVDRGGGNHFVGLDFLGPSGYEASVRALVEGEVYAEETVEFTVGERGLEDNGFDGDNLLLQQLARSTGGASYRIGEIDRLASDLNPGMVVTNSFRELRLRLTLPFFIVLALLLGLEWFIRKRNMLI